MAGDELSSARDAPGWRCIVISRTDVGAGRDKHVVYDAQSQASGQAAQALRFRFSEIVQLHTHLQVVPELADVELPRLPPKVTMRSVFGGRFDESFHEERLALVQQFFDSLGQVLGEKYSGVGDCTELCEPIGDFVRKASGPGDAAEAAAAEAAVRAAEVFEDREIVAEQNAEFEESLRMDELRAVEERERQEAQRRAAQAAEEEQRKMRETADEKRRATEQAAEARAHSLRLRRVAFEELYPMPVTGAPARLDGSQASLRIKSASGATLTRIFSGTMPVSALFEFVAVTEWPGAPAHDFDLRTSFPVRGLKGIKEQTLEEAGLCPSAALLVAEDEADDSPKNSNRNA